MVTIIVNNEKLDLYPGTSFSYEVNSPFFTSDVIFGSTSLPINIPPTNNNKKVLDFYNKIDRVGTSATYACMVLVDGVLLANGSLKIKWVGDKFIGNILAQSSAYANKSKDKKLYELSIPNQALVAADLYNTILPGGYPNVTFNLPMVLNDSDTKDWYQFYPGNDINIMNYGRDAGSGFRFVEDITPMPYMLYVLEMCFKEFGYTTGGTFFSDADMRKIILFNNRAIFPNYLSTINVDLKQHLPDVTIHKFINAIRSFFCLCIDVNPFKSDVEIYNINEAINNSEYIDITDITNPNYYKEDVETRGYVFQQTYPTADPIFLKPENHLSGYKELDCVANLTALAAVSSPAVKDARYVISERMYYRYDSSTGVGPQWNPLCYDQNLTPTIKKILGVTITGSVADLTALNALTPTAGAIYFVEKLNQYYWGKTFKTATVVWEYYCDNIAELTVGDGFKKVEIPAGTLSMITFERYQRVHSATNTFTRGMLMPKTQERLIIPGSGAGLTDSLSLIFHHGMRNDGNGNPYPFASNGPYDYAGNKIGNYSLSFHGTDGVYEKFWKNWATVLDTKTQITVRASINMNFLANLSFKRKVRIRGINYYVKRINCRLPLREPATLDLIKA